MDVSLVSLCTNVTLGSLHTTHPYFGIDWFTLNFRQPRSWTTYTLAL